MNTAANNIVTTGNRNFVAQVTTSRRFSALIVALLLGGVAHAQAGRPAQAVAYLEKFAVRAEPGPRRDRALAMAQELRQASQRR